MKAESGWVWAGDEPPGWYSTSTPFMLLPGTFGSAWSKTTVTFDLSEGASWAEAPASAMLARATVQRILVSMCGLPT
jgi:hypothetical protein